MAWFNFGKKDSSAALADAPVETVESLRLRAKRRLIGSLVLVLVAVVGFPLLFDTQPRPLLVDVPIEIPDKNKVKPLAVPSPVPASAASASPTARVDDKSSLQAKEEIIAPSHPNSKQNQQIAVKDFAPNATKTIATPKPEADKAADKAAADKKAAEEKAAKEKADQDKNAQAEAERVKALLEGKTSGAGATSTPAATMTALPAGERYVVQFGSFAENNKAREARLKVEKAGLKTYVQIAETAQGKLIRVRVGPFATKAEAEKAAAKIRALDLPAAILTL